jgi:hypothetical protein
MTLKAKTLQRPLKKEGVILTIIHVENPAFWKTLVLGCHANAGLARVGAIGRPSLGVGSLEPHRWQ